MCVCVAGGRVDGDVDGIGVACVAVMEEGGGVAAGVHSSFRQSIIPIVLKNSVWFSFLCDCFEIVLK